MKFLERWLRMGVSLSSSSSRGSARAVSCRCQYAVESLGVLCTYFQLPVQPRGEFSHDHAGLLTPRHKRLPLLQEHPPPFHQVRHPQPVHLEPRIILRRAGLPRRHHDLEVSRILRPLLVRHRLPPVQVQARDERRAPAEVRAFRGQRAADAHLINPSLLLSDRPYLRLPRLLSLQVCD
jgi:hypothetical protein